MSLKLYSGTPGSYKSFHAVKTALHWLRSGGNLITNFPVDYSCYLHKTPKGIYRCVNNFELTVDYLVDFACIYHKKSVKAQTLVVIDEASIKFNSRDFNARDRMGWINFLANHRHFNFEIIFISQMDIMIDKQIRGLIETEFKHRSVKNFKFFGAFLNLIFRGCYMCVEYWYPCKKKVGADLRFFSKRVARCYDTMSLFVDSQNKMTKAREKLNSIQSEECITNDKKIKKFTF